jgi:hypothetical protein
VLWAFPPHVDATRHAWRGYVVRGLDGEAGVVDDVIVEAGRCALVVDGGRLIPGGRIRTVDDHGRTVTVDLPVALVRRSPRRPGGPPDARLFVESSRHYRSSR